MLNFTTLQGRLVADPELRQTQNGVYVASARIAVNRNFKNSRGEYDSDFINLVAWRGTAEFLSKHFRKGQMVIITGSIQTRQYEDKSGAKRIAFEVVADQVFFGEGRKSEGSGPVVDIPKPTQPTNWGYGGGYEEYSEPGFEEYDGDVPF